MPRGSPAVAQLKAMTPTAILKTLESGVMRAQAAALSTNERQAIANFLGTAVTTERRRDEMANPCPAPAPGWKDGPGWSSWGAGLANTRFQTARDAGLRAEDVPRLTLKWAFAFPDSSVLRSQPAVYRGSVFVGSQNGDVYALDAATGCVHWTTTVQAEVRSGITVAEVAGKPTLFFGDSSGYLYALDGGDRKAAVEAAAGRASGCQDDVHAGVSPGTAVRGRLFARRSAGGVAGLCLLHVPRQRVGNPGGGREGSLETIHDRGGGEGAAADQARLGGLSAPRASRVWTAPTLDPERDTMYVTTGDNYSDPTTPLSDAVVALRMSSGRDSVVETAHGRRRLEQLLYARRQGELPGFRRSRFRFRRLGHAGLAGQRTARAAARAEIGHGVRHRSGSARPDPVAGASGRRRHGRRHRMGSGDGRPQRLHRPVRCALSGGAGRRAATTAPTNSTRTKGGGMFAFRVDNGERIWQTPPPGCGDRGRAVRRNRPR